MKSFAQGISAPEQSAQSHEKMAAETTTSNPQSGLQSPPPSEPKYAHSAQPRKYPTDPPSCSKKEENNSPNAEKSERLRRKNGRSTSRKEKASARGVGNSPSVPRNEKMAAPRPLEGGGRAIRPERLRPPRPARQLKAAVVNDGHKSLLPTLVPQRPKLS